MTSLDPTLLTADEAAAIARCSVKTVRRAYANGALVAYRRRGSRAVLLARQDVVEWAQGQVVEPTRSVPPAAGSVSVPPLPRRAIRKTGPQGRASRLVTEQRVDLSVDALRDRRGQRIESVL
jgi:excisionase family DNA binding protein